jgi:hypothetical protein
MKCLSGAWRVRFPLILNRADSPISSADFPQKSPSGGSAPASGRSMKCEGSFGFELRLPVVKILLIGVSIGFGVSLPPEKYPCCGNFQTVAKIQFRGRTDPGKSTIVPPGGG